MAISFVGATSNSTANGNTVTLTLPSTLMAAGDCVIVAYSVPRAITMGVTSSSTSTGYTEIVSTVTSGNLRFAVYRRIVPTAETNAICTGTGNAQDANAAVALIFRGVDQSTPEDATATSTLGSGTTPDSPSITIVTSNAAIISAVGSLTADATVTAPSSFLNQTDANASDTRSVTTAQAWLTSASTSSFDPGSWSNFTSAAWCSATIALRPASTAVFQWYPTGADSAAELLRERLSVKVSEYF